MSDESAQQGSGLETLSEDEKLLAELGYKQELNRSWSGFSNFAISFSIISILAGCFTTFCERLERRRPGGHRLGLADPRGADPVHRALHGRAGLGLPDLGRHLLVGLQARRGQGRLLHRLAQPDRPAGHRGLRRLRVRDLPRPDPGLPHARQLHRRAHLDTIFIYFMSSWWSRRSSTSSPATCWRIINNISVWWHVFGAAAVVLILVFLPDHHASVHDGLHLDREQHRLLRRARPTASASCSSSCPSAPF